MPNTVPINAAKLVSLKKQIDALVKEWDDIGHAMEKEELHGWVTESKLQVLRDQKSAHLRNKLVAKKKKMKLEHLIHVEQAKREKEREWLDLPDISMISVIASTSSKHARVDDEDEEEAQEEASDQKGGLQQRDSGKEVKRLLEETVEVD
ncbi:hypothetical protein KVT40_001197 [Elsinoe batatas]|uniref:Uncharacterized protein n=1 Tax=Elsinoe batatas TaxID=2601811 RepID=A0A8K0PL03_9PEZI|nr:hypothetical protein KVT40_001197 [Elsinoe batatas]